jgi:hypothetical protein
MVLSGFLDDGTMATYWCFKHPTIRLWNAYSARLLIDQFEAMEGESESLIDVYTQKVIDWNCSHEVEPVDAIDTRSPQAVHTALLPYFVDRDIVEFGTHHGDGMNCFARVAKSAVAVEPDEKECAALEIRAEELRSKGLGSFEVLCGGFPDVWRDADIFTWWQDLGWREWRNWRILLHLRRLQDSGLVRKNAQALFIFDPMLPLDRMSWYHLEKLFTMSKRVQFDEKDDCFRRAAWPDEPFSCEARGKGSFLIAAIPIRNIPHRL